MQVTFVFTTKGRMAAYVKQLAPERLRPISAMANIARFKPETKEQLDLLLKDVSEYLFQEDQDLLSVIID